MGVSTDHPRRLVLALCASLAAHAVLLAGPPAGRPAVHPSRVSPAPAITAHIEPVSPSGSDPEARIEAATAPSEAESERVVVHPLTPTVRPEHNAHAAKSTDERPSAIAATPVIPDPTWYSARDLDVYPRPVAPIRLDFLDGTRLVFQLLIDEHGAVREVTVVEALLQGDLEQKARSAVAAARFLPAMKDERAVRSRVLLRVE